MSEHVYSLIDRKLWSQKSKKKLPMCVTLCLALPSRIFLACSRVKQLAVAHWGEPCWNWQFSYVYCIQKKTFFLALYKTCLYKWPQDSNFGVIHLYSFLLEYKNLWWNLMMLKLINNFWELGFGNVQEIQFYCILTIAWWGIPSSDEILNLTMYNVFVFTCYQASNSAF